MPIASSRCEWMSWSESSPRAASLRESSARRASASSRCCSAWTSDWTLSRWITNANVCAAASVSAWNTTSSPPTWIAIGSHAASNTRNETASQRELSITKPHIISSSSRTNRRAFPVASSEHKLVATGDHQIAAPAACAQRGGNLRMNTSADSATIPDKNPIVIAAVRNVTGMLALPLVASDTARVKAINGANTRARWSTICSKRAWSSGLILWYIAQVG